MKYRKKTWSEEAMGRCITALRSVSWAYLLWHTVALVCAKSLQSCLTLCDPMSCSLPGSSVHGILQARILSGLPWPLPGGPPPLRDQIYISHLSCICRRFLYHYSHLGSPLVALISTWGGCPLTMPRFTWSFLHIRWHSGVVPRLSCFGCGLEFSQISLPLSSPLFLPCPSDLEGIALLR